VFGPLVRQAAAERSPLVAERLPLMLEVLQHVAHPAIRSRGTVVGSIAHADPAAELPALFVLLEGEARVRPTGRTVRAADLFVSHLETSLEPGEWIEQVRLPARSGGAFEEFARRHGDYALCGVAALAGAFSFVGMGATPVRFVGDVREAVAQLEPEDDIHATAEYRRHLALRLAERVVERA
jgi:carbon-monoxide dehydrogenase medium subunit